MAILRRTLQLAGVAAVAATTSCSGAPGPVQQAFDQRYPGFETVTWEQQPYGWEAAFGGDDGAYEAEFDASGQWLETEVEVVDAAGFPAAVRQAVQSVTGGSRVDKWEIEVTPQGEFYEIETLGSDGEYYFDPSGRQVSNQHEDA
jgi:Putative beta-lactamase-inhibitor-like, PepSY-like